ncbi:hypothetical protein DD630_11690 [Streptomyces sp. BSE7F]|nr:hypothetical protein DD630_11690 [Streptomyces sp. BSE7F]
MEASAASAAVSAAAATSVPSVVSVAAVLSAASVVSVVPVTDVCEVDEVSVVVVVVPPAACSDFGSRRSSRLSRASRTAPSALFVPSSSAVAGANKLVTGAGRPGSSGVAGAAAGVDALVVTVTGSSAAARSTASRAASASLRASAKGSRPSGAARTARTRSVTGARSVRADSVCGSRAASDAAGSCPGWEPAARAAGPVVVTRRAAHRAPSAMRRAGRARMESPFAGFGSWTHRRSARDTPQPGVRLSVRAAVTLLRVPAVQPWCGGVGAANPASRFQHTCHP